MRFDFLKYFVYFVLIVVSLPFHEFSHAYVAKLLGDDSAKKAGRLTLNPARHIDLIGVIAVFIAGFGWAKPVPVNLRKFAHPKRDMVIVSLAGPVSNFLLALISLFLYKAAILLKTFVFKGMSLYSLTYIVLFFQYFAIMNVTLAVFNLIPIPPLDGSRFLMSFLTNRQYYIVLFLERFGFIVLFILVLNPQFDEVIGFVSEYILKWFDQITSSLEIFNNILLMG